MCHRCKTNRCNEWIIDARIGGWRDRMRYACVYEGKELHDGATVPGSVAGFNFFGHFGERPSAAKGKSPQEKRVVPLFLFVFLIF